MKKVLLILTTLLIGYFTTNAQQYTTIFEDDFESYDEGTNLTNEGYIVWAGTASVATIGGAFEGDKYGKSDVSKNEFYFRKEFTLEAGKTYRWEITTKIQDGAKHVLSVVPANVYVNAKTDVLNASDWVTTTIDFTVVEGSENVTLALYRWARKIVYFDNFVLKELIPTAEISLTDDGEILEGAEDGEVINVSLTNDTFVETLTPANWTATGLPAGVTIDNISRVSSNSATITLAGNTTIDYDMNITDAVISVSAGELVASNLDVSATGITFTAVIEDPFIFVTDDGQIVEGAEDGEILTVNLINDIFDVSVTPTNWTASNLPAGVVIKTITRIDDNNVTVELSGNATNDYDADIVDVSISVSSDEFATYGKSLSTSGGVTFTATVEVISITIAEDGEILEGAEDGEIITVQVVNDVFTSSVTATGFAAQHLPAGVSLGTVNRVNDNTVEINLSGNATADYDTDITNVQITVKASELVDSNDDVTANTGVTLTAVIEPSLTLSFDGEILEGEEDGEILTVNITDGTFAATLTLANWTAENLPDGVTLGSVTKISDTSVAVKLSGNSSSDYDADITGTKIIVGADEIATFSESVNVSGDVVFTARIEGTFTTIFEDTFEDYDVGTDLTSLGYIVWEGTAKISTVDAYEGEKYGKSDDSKINFAFRKDITLEAGKTYMLQITTKIAEEKPYKIQVHPKDLYEALWVTASNTDWETHTIVFTVEEGNEDITLAVYRWAKTVVSFDNITLKVEGEVLPAEIAIADDGNITEGAEDGEKITVTLTNDTFVETLTTGNWTVNNLPEDVSVDAVNRVDDTTVEIVLSGNTTGDYDADITDVEVVVAAAELANSLVAVSANTGVTFTAVVETSIANNKLMNLNIYPNPVTDVLNINSDTEILSVNVYNVQGKLMLQKANQKNTSATLNFAHLKSGMYFIIIEHTDNKIVTRKVMK